MHQNKTGLSTRRLSGKWKINGFKRVKAFSEEDNRECLRKSRNLNKRPDFLDKMHYQNKILISVLGGATLGVLVMNYQPVLLFWLSFGLNLQVINILGLLGGGYLGYRIGRRV